MRCTVILVLLLLCCPLVLSADVIHVPGVQPTIQAGIDAAVDGDKVLVADGTYTGQGNRDIDFLGKAITVRSENGAENCIIDCEEQGRGFNFFFSEGENSVLDGFTIQNGYHALRGGGINCDAYTSPTITNCTFSANRASDGGGMYCEDGSPTFTNCTFSANVADWGGGIYCVGSSPTITNCTFSENRGPDLGGGIYCVGSSPKITNCTFSENRTVAAGGGIACEQGSPTITDCIFNGNGSLHCAGGGIYCTNSSPKIFNCIFNGNDSDRGGGIYCFWAPARITNCTFSRNRGDDLGGGVYCMSSSPIISNCIIWDNSPNSIEVYSGDPLIYFSDVQGGWPGGSNIDADPLFVSGPHGVYYLSNVICGDPENSPCVGAGLPSLELCGTTRCLAAWGSKDMGYHYPATGIVVGPGPHTQNPPTVRVFPPEQNAEAAFEFNAYGGAAGVNVSCGDVFADGVDQIITGPGPGPIFGPHVRGFQVDGAPLEGLSYLAYGTSKWGVNVAAGDIDGDGFDEIITGAGPGAVFGPHVRGWDYDGGPDVTPISTVSYFAYGTPKWGVNVSAGDIDGDGYDEIVTGAGPGAVYGPHVRGWNVDGGTAASIPGCSFIAYGTHKYGVNISCGDVDGDGIDEIITAPGPSPVFGAHIRGFDMNGTPLPGLSFLAWPPSGVRYGAKVFAGSDLDGEGWNEIVVGCGPDPDANTEVKVFQYDGSGVTPWFSLEAFQGMTHGANVAAGRF